MIDDDNAVQSNSINEIDRISALLASTVTDQERVRLLIERARCYQCNEEVSLSVRDYLDALEIAVLKSDIVHINAMVALALAKKVDQKESALFFAINSIDCDPSSAEAWHCFGLVCAIVNFQKIAAFGFRMALSSNPNARESLLALGRALRDDEQYSQAVVELERYITMYPRDAYGFFHLAWAIRDSTKSQKSSDRAVAILRHALSLEPPKDLQVRIRRMLGELE